MRIVVHGQQAFGKAVLEALLEARRGGGRGLCRAREAGRQGRSAQGSRGRRQAAGLSAGVLPQAGGVGAIQGAQARFAGDGLRHAVRAGGIPQHPDARLDPVSPLAAAGLSRAVARSTGRSSKARRKPGCRSFGPTTGSIPATVLLQKKTPISATDTLGTVYFDRLFPMGVEAMLESIDLVKAGKAPRIKQDEAKATYEGRCGPDNAKIDWGKPWEQIDRADPRLQSGARRLDDARRQAAQDLRRQAAARQGPERHRRQDGRDRRRRRRQFHRGLRRRPHQGHARAARRRQKDRRRRIHRHGQARGRGALHLISFHHASIAGSPRLH